MTFANPSMLWLLLVLPPALVAFFWWSGRRRKELMARFIEARLLPDLVEGVSVPRQRLRQGAFVLAMACLILALARPQWGFHWEEARIRGLDIVVALDTSKSMLAEDIAPNRLARAKLAAQDLVNLAKSDRLGLVLFAGTAFLQCPLTIDDLAFLQSVESADVNTLPQGGTAIAEAINTALTAFKEGDNYKVLVLLSDGEDQDSGAAEAAKKAAAAGLRIFTIGIGTEQGEVLRVKTPDGRSMPVRDENGKEVTSKLNEELLREIAGSTEGGFYLPLRGAKTVETLYQQGLARLPKSDRQEKLVKRYHERYYWPLGMALLLLIVEMFMNERGRQRKAGNGSSAVRRAMAAVVLLLAVLWLPVSAEASSASALREYKAGRFDQAQKDYEQALKRKDDPRLRFNAGTAAYQDGHYEDALKRFTESLNSPDLKLQEWSFYNRGNSLFQLGENNPDPAKRSESWKKAMQDFQSTLKLNPKDEDAKHNYEYVKKRLEEQPPPPQQNQQDKQDKDNKDQQDQQQQQQQPQQGQQNQDQQQQQSQPQNQASQDKKQNQPQPQEAQNKETQEQQAAQQQQKEEQQEQAGAASQSQDQQNQSQEAAEPIKPGQMTPQEARRLLDAQKNQEKMLPPTTERNAPPPQRRVRDW